MAVDYLTKWPIVKALRQATSSRCVIQALREIFADWGTPEKLISDNASQFTCLEFQQFCSQYCVMHRTSSPLHASGNGQVERTIGTIKAMMKKCMSAGDNWVDGLLAIRNTPIANGLRSPAQYLQGRVLRDKIPVAAKQYAVQPYDLMKLREQLGEQKERDKFYFDSRAGNEKMQLNKGQDCYFKMANGPWVRGKVGSQVSERSYLVRKACGTEYRRNRKDIRKAGKVSESDVFSDAGEVNLDGEEVSAKEMPAVVPPENIAARDPPRSPQPQREHRLPSKYKDTIVYFK